MAIQSSGVLAVLMNLTLDETADAAFHAQAMWQSGNISRFDLVDHFFETLLPHDNSSPLDDLDRILPNLKILVTTQRDGHQVRQPQNRTELKDLLIKTTWVYVFSCFHTSPMDLTILTCIEMLTLFAPYDCAALT